MLVAARDALAASLEARLRGEARWRVAVGASTQLPQLVDEYEPVAILLSESPERLGRALETLRTRLPSPPVILLLTDPRGAWTPRVHREGVSAVLRADATAPELRATISAVVAGLVVLHPDVLGARSAVSPRAASQQRGLTPREREILELMTEGLSNHRIAVRLGIARDTVKFHVASILAKLGAASRTEAVTSAVRRGLVSL